MLKRNKIRLGTIAVIVTTATLLGTYAANADPTAGTFPVLAGVGSDTIQDVMNGLATNIPAIGSNDATAAVGASNTTTIQTRAGGAFFTRPNGSGAGVNALSASIDGSGYGVGSVVISNDVDFARSSSGPSVAGTNLTFIPFAQDAVTFAVNEASAFPRDIPLGTSADPSTKLTLYNIYRCTATSYADADGNSVTIRPLLPQSGSGTRKFWESTLGLTDSTLASCVTDINNTVEEHNGTYLTGAGDIMPFSIAQFIAQGNHGVLPSNVTERRGGATLGSINGVAPFVISGTSITQNPSFGVKRLVYNVVQTSRLTSDANISATFLGTSSAVCADSAIIKEYGFATIGAQCGSTTVTGGLTQ
jgi:hypothetical protein